MNRSLRDLDLNLMTIFVQLYEDRSVSSAAANLGMSQPAVSNALARLRLLLVDEVFLRTSRGMQPTPLADKLATPISNALSAIRESIAQPLQFDAATSTRQFTIAMTDIGEVHFLPSLMEKLEAQAPGISISTVRNTAVNLRFEMENGKVDLAIGHLPDLTTDFHRRILFSQRYVCLFRKGHPIDRTNVTQEDFVSASHAVVISAGTGHGRVDDDMARMGVRRRVSLKVPHFVALADILCKTNLIATVPEAFAQRSVRHFDLKYITHPLELPQIDISMFWHTKFKRDPANRWIRELVSKRYRSLRPEVAAAAAG